jgi:phosphate transport system permease protein
MGEALPDLAPSLARRGAERALQWGCWGGAILVAATFLSILGQVAARGAGQLSWEFLVEAPRGAGREGGVGPIVVSTLLVLAVCLAVAVPLGLGTALLLAEFAPRRGPLAGLTRMSLDVLAGVPSIVFGLFGNALFCVTLGLGFSILSGGLTLACMVLPLLIRGIELGLRSVPDDLRLAGAALGMSRGRLILHVLLPAATPGLAAGLMLGVARAVAETAALLFTSGSVDRMPGSLCDSGRTLSVHVYELSMNVPGGEDRAAATALITVALLLAINLASTWTMDRVLRRGVSPP